ncbi:Metalregulatory transcription factor 1, partial [Caligus rogercresseyi]
LQESIAFQPPPPVLYQETPLLDPRASAQEVTVNEDDLMFLEMVLNLRDV